MTKKTQITLQQILFYILYFIYFITLQKNWQHPKQKQNEVTVAEVHGALLNRVDSKDSICISSELRRIRALNDSAIAQVFYFTTWYSFLVVLRKEHVVLNTYKTWEPKSHRKRSYWSRRIALKIAI